MKGIVIMVIATVVIVALIITILDPGFFGWIAKEGRLYP